MNTKTKIFNFSSTFAHGAGLLVLCAVLFCSQLILAGCSSHSEGAAISTELGFVDILIGQGKTKEAMELLQRTEKLASTPLESMGVYKRYVILGESGRAEKALKKGLRKHKKDKQLLAVYGNFLLDQNKTKKALKVTKPLSGTEYGSIYAEAFLSYALETGWSADDLFGKTFFLFRGHKKNPDHSATAKEKFEVFYDSRFVPIYLDAARSTKLSRWARNAAALCMKEGNFAKASEAYTGSVDSLEDSLFWGSVFYDAGLYTESLEALVAGDSFPGSVALKIEHKALEADDYYLLEEDAAAEKIRSELIDVILAESVNANAGLTSYAKQVLPVVYVNSAMYLKSKNDLAKEFSRLDTLVTKFPDYVPGLASYGDYALYLLSRPPEDKLSQDLRYAGLRTMAMEEEDRIPKISLEDALVKIDESLERTNNPRLIVIREQLLAQLHREWETEHKASRVWPLLEKNALEKASLFPDDVVHYAVVVLLNNGHEQDARDLFIKYEQAKHEEELTGKKKKVSDESKDDIPPKFEPSEHPELLNLWEKEAAAWFYVNDGRIDEGLEMYGHIIENFAKRTPTMNSGGKSESVTNAYINIANIYAGRGQGVLALDSLKKALPRTLDEGLKADVLYRIGKEYYYQGDYKNAIRSLQYSLNQDNGQNKVRNRARLILKQAQDRNK
ncbi:MAG: hypothetical protein K6E22_06725 [Treponema sp.]|nr:hypothetical protein [Treponema sp.]